MKTTVKIIIYILFLIISASCTVQRSGTRWAGNNSAQVFYDELEPYGDWVHNREYGYVWIPRVGRNFYPYATDGRWVMTDYGWTWFSDYNWGWAPFHYGRWDYDMYYGWVWFPDIEWAPAWVTWRSGNGYFGWSPMRPGSQPAQGYNYTDEDRWIFVRDRDFTRTNIGRYYVNNRQNDDILSSTRVIENISTDNRRRVNYFTGPDPSEVQSATGKRIVSVAVRDNDRPGQKLNNSQLQIYRPRIENNIGQNNRPAPSRISDIKDIRPVRERNRNYQPDIERGGNRVLDPNAGQGQREEAQQKELDTRQQYNQKQDTFQRRQQQSEMEQRQRSRESDNQMRRVQKANRQQQLQRRQQTDQQKKLMQKEQERERIIEPSDSSGSRRVERQQSGNIRRRK